jgi:hypothetical protein
VREETPWLSAENIYTLSILFILYCIGTMNNEQFRRLLFDNPLPSVSSNTIKSSNINDHFKKDVASGSGSGGEGRGANTARPAMLLGAKMRSNLPMTPYVFFFLIFILFLFFPFLLFFNNLDFNLSLITSLQTFRKTQ